MDAPFRLVYRCAQESAVPGADSVELERTVGSPAKPRSLATYDVVTARTDLQGCLNAKALKQFRAKVVGETGAFDADLGRVVIYSRVRVANAKQLPAFKKKFPKTNFCLREQSLWQLSEDGTVTLASKDAQAAAEGTSNSAVEPSNTGIRSLSQEPSGATTSATSNISAQRGTKRKHASHAVEEEDEADQSRLAKRPSSKPTSAISLLDSDEEVDQALSREDKGKARCKDSNSPSPEGQDGGDGSDSGPSGTDRGLETVDAGGETNSGGSCLKDTGNDLRPVVAPQIPTAADTEVSSPKLTDTSAARGGPLTTLTTKLWSITKASLTAPSTPLSWEPFPDSSSSQGTPSSSSLVPVQSPINFPSSDASASTSSSLPLPVPLSAARTDHGKALSSFKGSVCLTRYPEDRYVELERGSRVFGGAAIESPQNVVLGHKNVILGTIIGEASTDSPSGPTMTVGNHNIIGIHAVLRPPFAVDANGRKKTVTPAVVGSYILVGEGADISAKCIGDFTEFGDNCLVGNGAMIGKCVRIGALAIVDDGVTVPDYSHVLANSSKPARMPLPTEARMRKTTTCWYERIPVDKRLRDDELELN